MGCAHLSGSDNVIDLAFSQQEKLLAVANGSVVDVMRDGVVQFTITPPEAPLKVAYDRGRIAVVSSNNVYYYLGDTLSSTIAVAGGVDVILGSREDDSNPQWSEQAYASWKTEPASATRAGSTDFPRDFMIVSYATQVIIYDLIGGKPSMWMVFTRHPDLTAATILGDVNFPSNTTLSYSEGVLFLGTPNYGMVSVSFVMDMAIRWRANGPPVSYVGTYPGNISQRNVGYLPWGQNPTALLVNDTVNDVASTVLTEVPVVNVATGTEDLTNAARNKVRSVAVDATTLREDSTSAASHYMRENVAALTDIGSISARCEAGTRTHIWLGQNVSSPNRIAVFDLTNGTITYKGADVLATILPDPQGGYRCTLSGAGFTGWFDIGLSSGPNSGDIFYDGDGASDAQITDIQCEVGSINPHNYVPNTGNPISTILSDNFDAVNVPLFSDDFNRVTLDPWIDASDGSGTASMVGNQLQLVRGASSGDIGKARLNLTNFVEDRWYTVSVEHVSLTGNAGILVGETPGSSTLVNVAGGQGNIIAAFKASQASLWIELRGNTNLSTQLLDDFSVEEVPALDDWNNAKGTSVGAVSIESGGIRTENVGGSGFAVASTPITTEIGRTYRITGDLVAASGVNAQMAAQNNANGTGTVGFQVVTVGNSFDFTFEATATTTYIGTVVNSGATGQWCRHDNVAVQSVEDGIGTTPPAKQLKNRTNVIRDSQDTAESSWSTTAGCIKTTGTPILDPEGNPYSSRVEGNSTIMVFRANLLAADFIGQNTLSGWLYVHNLGAVTEFRLDIKDGPQVSIPLTSNDVGKWLRIEEVQINTGAAGADFIDCQTFGDATGFEFSLWGFQLEEAGPVSPLIKTFGQATTATDDVGMFVPDWAVATDGGISRGADTGSVYDITGQSEPQSQNVAYGDGVILANPYNFSNELGVYNIPYSDVLFSSYTRRYYPSTAATDPGAPKLLDKVGQPVDSRGIAIIPGGFAWGTNAGLTLVEENFTDYFDGIYQWITSSYKSGFMKDSEGAYLNDTDSDPAGFPFSLYEDFSASNVPEYQSDFASLDGWLPGTVDSLLTLVSDQLRVENGAAAQAYAYQSFTTEIDKWYTVNWSNSFDPANGTFSASTAPGGIGLGSAINGNSFTFRATSVITYLNFFVNSGTIGAASLASDISFEEVAALEGWIPGTGTTAPVVSITAGVLSLENSAADVATISKSLGVLPAGNFNVVLDHESVTASTAVGIRVGTTAQGSEIATLEAVFENQVGLRSFVNPIEQEVFISINTASANPAAVPRFVGSITAQEALVENGTFDTNTTGWAPAGSSFVSTSGEGILANQAGQFGRVQQALTLEVGKVYRLSVGFRLIDVNGILRVGTTSQGSDVVSTSLNSTGTYVEDFEATTSTLFLSLWNNSTVGGQSSAWDNVIVTELLPDNSGNGNHAPVTGQITKEELGNTCLQAGCFAAPNGIRLPDVPVGAQIIGWYRAPGTTEWVFINSINPGPNTFVDLAPGCYGMIRVNGTPMTDDEIQDIIDQEWPAIGGGQLATVGKATSDLRYDCLVARGFQGAVNQMLLDYLQLEGGHSIAQINDAWLATLKAKGRTENNVTDAKFNYFRSLGYTGAMPDMENQFWDGCGFP